eukprot:3331854-Amphidinium_carterae.1
MGPHQGSPLDFNMSTALPSKMIYCRSAVNKYFDRLGGLKERKQGSMVVGCYAIDIRVKTPAATLFLAYTGPFQNLR